MGEIDLRVRELFTGNWCVERDGKMLVSDLHTMKDAYEWVYDNMPGVPFHTLTDREKWLNGWVRGKSPNILVHCNVRCVCCGRDQGTTCVIMTEEDIKRPEPDWPFNEENCPLCTTG